MARTFDGAFGDATGSGEDITVVLDGTVEDNDLLLVFVAWEPLALTGIYTIPEGSVYHRNVLTGDFLLPNAIKGTVATFDDLPATGNTYGDTWITTDTGQGWVWWDEWVEADPRGAYFNDLGTRTPAARVGFFEGPQSLIFERLQDIRAAGVAGYPCYPTFPEYQPSGATSLLIGLQHPDGFDKLTIPFRAIEPSEPYAVTWSHVETWIIREFGTVANPAGFVGVAATEPGAYREFVHQNPDTGDWITDYFKYACVQGEEYEFIKPDFTPQTAVSDGGDTRMWIAEADGTTLDELVPHVLEYGIAGRWGQGEGTYTWTQWPGTTKISTLGHSSSEPATYGSVAATYATYTAFQTAAVTYSSVPGQEVPAYWEVFYKLLPSQAPVALGAQGTFGAQTYAQTGAGELHYRGNPAGGFGTAGAMWRGANIAITSVPTGGWLPQIYRRIGPAQ